MLSEGTDRDYNGTPCPEGWLKYMKSHEGACGIPPRLEMVIQRFTEMQFITHLCM